MTDSDPVNHEPANPADPLAWLSGELTARDQAHLRRRLRVRDVAPEYDFSANDYLALRRDPRLHQAGLQAAARCGAGAGSSPAVSGWGAAHKTLAEKIARWKGAEAALVFTSGYVANQSTVAALAGAGDAVYADRLSHACLVDGARLGGASLRIFPHNDVAKLERILERDRGRFRRRLIVTESLFSMDGDTAPLAELAQVARQQHAMLLIDEAHGTGLFGDGGQGLAEAAGLGHSPGLVRLGTLSKAVGVQGGYVAGPQMLVDWLVQSARGWIYSTAISPYLAGAAACSIEIIKAEGWRRTNVLAQAALLRQLLNRQGWHIPAGQGPIVPVVVGNAAKVVAIGQTLENLGFAVGVIRPPTVPAGTARLRISLHAGHAAEDVERLAAALAQMA